MTDGARGMEVEEVDDLSGAEPAPLAVASTSLPSSRRRRRRGVVGVAAVVTLLLTAGLWQQHRAQTPAEARGAGVSGDEDAAGGAALVSSSRQRADLVTAAAGSVTTALESTGAAPAWGPVDLGARAADVDGPVDLQGTGWWPPAPDGVQRVGYRLVTGLGQAAGRTPCQVPTVRINAWQYPQGGDQALACRVMAAGVRGTAQREGDSGAGSQRVQVREVVLVSGGRAASVAAWSTGEAEPSAELPALGAAAAALLASSSSDAGSEP